MASTVTELLRRRFMKGKKDDDYIKDGLVFHLDGINRGTTDPTKWVDLVGGVEFSGADGWGDNYRICSPTTTMTTTNMSEPNIRNCTVEFVFYTESNAGNQRLWVPRNSISPQEPNPSFGKYNTNYLLTNSVLYKISVPITSMPLAHNHCISFDTTKTIVDGGIVNTGTVDFYYGNRDGATSTIAGLKGKLFAIRFYNRILTNDEIVHNQRIDNERFNLGLTI